MLAQFNLAEDAVKKALLSMDTETLTLDKLKLLKNYVPTSTEIEILNKYNGNKNDLGTAERYLLEVEKLARKKE